MAGSASGKTTTHRTDNTVMSEGGSPGSPLQGHPPLDPTLPITRGLEAFFLKLSVNVINPRNLTNISILSSTTRKICH